MHVKTTEVELAQINCYLLFLLLLPVYTLSGTVDVTELWLNRGLRVSEARDAG